MKSGSFEKAATLVLITIIGIAGCSNKPSRNTKSKNDTPTTTKPDNTVTKTDTLRLLIWEGYAPEKYIKSFEKEIERKYGRKVKMVVSFVEGPEDFFDPIRRKKADIVTLTHHYFKDERFKYIDNNLLLPLNTTNIPNVSNVIPTLRKADYLSSSDGVFGIPICQGPYGLAYSTQKIETAPDSWKSLWDPQNKNKYVLGGKEYLCNVGITALAFGYPHKSINNFDALNNKEFKAKLRQLAENAGSFWVGMDTADDLTGKSLAAVWGDSLGSLKKRGEI